MIKYFFVVYLLLNSALTFSQSKPKPVKPGDKPPTQKEMEAAMKEAAEGLSAEDIKMMEKMGIKMPSVKDMPKGSEKGMADVWQDETALVPRRDEKRIASISKGVTIAHMKQYVSEIHKGIVPVMEAQTSETGQAIFAYLEKEKISRDIRGNTAMGLWTSGYPQVALFLLGKVTSDTPTVSNLNNYASMLTMLGGEHLAIPILENLATVLPENIIVLNNLGQAWFGLGDLTKAEKYFNKCLAIYPYHPQSNLSKAVISESKGETARAIEEIRNSIKHAYTAEKHKKLRSLGYKLTLDDLRYPFKPDVDPLLLSKYNRPDYPKSVAESKSLQSQWDLFMAECDNQLKNLRKEYRDATEKYNAYVQKISKGNIPVASNSGSVPTYMQIPIYATKAGLQMNERKSFFDLKLKELMKKRETCRQDLEKIKKEKKICVPEAPCTCFMNAETDFLNKFNERKQLNDEEALKFYRQYFGEMVYWSQYTSLEDAQFDVIRLQFLIDYMEKLSSSEYKPEFTRNDYQECIEEEKVKPFKLAEWDFSKNCAYTAEIKYPLITQQINCSHTTTIINAEFLKNLPVVGMGYKRTLVEVGVEFERSTVVLTPKIELSTDLVPLPVTAGFNAEATITMNTNKAGETDWNAVTKAGIELGVGRSIGPVKAKVSVSENIELEYDNTGLKDVNLVSEVKGKAGIELPKVDKTNPENNAFNNNIDLVNKGAKISGMYVKAGVEDRVSLMSGHGSVNGTGLLKAVKITKW